MLTQLAVHVLLGLVAFAALLLFAARLDD